VAGSAGCDQRGSASVAAAYLSAAMILVIVKIIQVTLGY
jgi:hypothetical protein